MWQLVAEKAARRDESQARRRTEVKFGQPYSSNGRFEVGLEK